MAPSSSPLLAESRALIDSLGYLDTEYNAPQSQQAVQALIRAEMARFSPPADQYLGFLPAYTPSFGGHTRLQSEFKRVAANVPLEAIDMNRYQVQAPMGKRAESLEAWEQAVRQQRVALENQNNRVTNLELQQSYGPKLAKVRAAVLDGLNAQYARELEAAKTQADGVNLQRQQEQSLNAAKLQSYQRKLDELLSKNAAIKRACVQQQARQAKKAKAS